MAFITPMMDIAFIAIAFSIVSFTLQHTLIDRKKMKADQERRNEQQKRLGELLKKNDDRSKKEAEKIQRDMLENLSATMNGSMKHMMVVMVIALPLLWFMGGAYAKETIPLPIQLPIVGETSSWITWYILVSLSASIVLSIIDKVYLEKKLNW